MCMHSLVSVYNLQVYGKGIFSYQIKEGKVVISDLVIHFGLESLVALAGLELVNLLLQLPGY